MVLELLHHGIVLETATKVRVRVAMKTIGYLSVNKSIDVTALDARASTRMNSSELFHIYI